MSDVYILKKDLPDVKAGRRLVDEGLFVFEEPTTIKERQYRFNRDLILLNTEWFEKEERAKQSMERLEEEKARQLLSDKGYFVWKRSEPLNQASGNPVLGKNLWEPDSHTSSNESVEEKAYSKESIIAQTAEAIDGIKLWHDKLKKMFSDGILSR